MTNEQIAKLEKEILEVIQGMSNEELQEDLDTHMAERRGLRAKMGLIDDAWIYKEEGENIGTDD